jgi:hypothetical protein
MSGTNIDAPTARQVRRGLQFCQHDRVVPQRRTDHAIASLDQHLHKTVQCGGVEQRDFGIFPVFAYRHIIRLAPVCWIAVEVD